jgi:hypothetical protein
MFYVCRNARPDFPGIVHESFAVSWHGRELQGIRGEVQPNHETVEERMARYQVTQLIPITDERDIYDFVDSIIEGIEDEEGIGRGSLYVERQPIVSAIWVSEIAQHDIPIGASHGYRHFCAAVPLEEMQNMVLENAELVEIAS